MKETTITFKLSAETKNTFKFEEAADAPIIGMLYVKKSAFPDGKAPASITVTLKA